jgi:hypothetical protein
MPVAQTRFPSQLDGAGENLDKSSPQIRIVKSWLGYGLSRFTNVGDPLLLLAV